MKNKKEPQVVRSMNLSDFELLTKEINTFRDGGDISFDDDTFEMNIYDNGDIELRGEFRSYETKMLRA